MADEEKNTEFAEELYEKTLGKESVVEAEKETDSTEIISEEQLVCKE